MLQSRGEQNLALESLDIHSRGKVGSDHLDDDASAERRVGCKEDTRHPAAAELAFEPVRVTEGLLERVAKRSGHPGSRHRRLLNFGRGTNSRQRATASVGVSRTTHA